ncbi:MAG TPA: hypothetical protein VJ841_01195 [Candidatus Saccharimonadales bacterium]|nr:hypothetical protein [Candidatus Saccharimonadales bacterium]
MSRPQFWLTALLMALMNILVVTTIGGYNTYTEDFDFGRGWEVVGGFFGGFIGLIFSLVVVAMVIGIVMYLKKQWQADKKGLVLVACVIIALFFGIFGFSWIANLTLGSLSSLLLLLFVIFQTWVVTTPYRRLTKRLNKKLAHMPAAGDSSESSDTSGAHA